MKSGQPWRLSLKITRSLEALNFNFKIYKITFLAGSPVVRDAEEAGESAARVLESAPSLPSDFPHYPQEDQQGQTVQEVRARLHDGGGRAVRGAPRGKGLSSPNSSVFCFAKYST